MSLPLPQDPAWLTYSSFDPKYFAKVREVRSLANQTRSSVKVDCQLALSCRCRVQDSAAAVLIIRLITSNAGHENVQLGASVKLIFGRGDGHATGTTVGRDSGHVAPGNSLRLTSCQPAAVKGLPQGKRKSVHSSIDPTISAGGIAEVRIGSYARDHEEDTSTSWSFNTSCQSENEPSGYYNGVLLQLNAADSRSLESFSQRPLTAAAVLEGVGELITVQSSVQLRTSAWLSRFRCWGRNMVTAGGNPNAKHATHRQILLGTQPKESYESFERLESLIRAYVKGEN